ncbi:hypothetical protein BPOR_0752g00020 [Botrytis porri]|uniref:Uncharacterized protein n=1 Tax=Botrytis porri TaxID=87229 RepID=A0A4Z1KBU0_9HELO|nr:hypothetical protein BPOR_0752g00020 [Botrytis porri]
MGDTTPNALAVIKPQGTDPPSVINLAEEFQRLQHEYDNVCGDDFEQAIQSKLLQQRKSFIHHLESMFSEINDNSNRKIREANAKFGLTLPLEELKKENKLEISSALGITITADPSSLSQPTESSDDKVAISQLLEDNHSLQNKLGESKNTLAKLEAEKKQDKTTIARVERSRKKDCTLQSGRALLFSCPRRNSGYHNSACCHRDEDGFHEIKGRPPADRKVIDARNHACHLGDIATDFALFMVDPNRAGWNIGGERYIDFTNSYRVTPHQWGKIVSLAMKSGPDRVLLEVLNLHSTMYRCYFNTEHSHSPENDEAFNVLFAKFFDKYKGLLASTNLFLSAKRYENLLIFVKQAVNDRRQ